MQKMYVSHVPDSWAWETDPLNISWEGLVSYVFYPVALIPSGDSTDDHLQVQNHHDFTRVARDVLLLGSGEFVHKTPKTSIVSESVDSTIQQSTSQQLTYLNLHVWHRESVMNIQEGSQRKW